MRDVILPDELGESFGNASSSTADNMGSEVFGKTDILGQGFLIFGTRIAAHINVKDVEFPADRLRHARSAGNDVLRGRVGADADSNPLAQRVRRFGIVFFKKGIKTAIND